MKHTRETCFKLHGYPDWWNELHAWKRRDATRTDGETGKAALAIVESSLSLTPPVESSQGMLSLPDSGNFDVALFSSHQEVDSSTWILDSGATDHMMFDANDFSYTSPLRRTSIANVNGVVSSVTGVDTLTLSPSLTLSNTILVPSLSHKLLSVSQVTTDLNFIVLIYPTFCLLKDILMEEIIGRGTKRGGLYCMDDFSVGRAHHMHHPSGTKEMLGFGQNIQSD